MRIGSQNLIVIGDRVLIKPEKPEERTAVGLYLPQSVLEKENVQGGRIVATGPGFLLPSLPESDDEPWRPRDNTPEPRFLPLQAEVGDYALYLRKEGVEIRVEEQTYIIVHHNAILAVLRPEPEDL